ncbi:hypothetical protein ACFYRC_34460 [Streptomyces sp. NPDC005279]|uniref:hypothetical protein n=1 Tax=Streptomyces sp. NPDC005279 TaxID=3364712 RepID=UPI00369D81DE
MTMVTTVSALGGLLGLIVSLMFLAKQTKAVSEQVRMGNVINGTTGIDACLNNVREIYFKMLEYPGMRAYFYDNKPCPDQGEERERILIMTEVLADVLETGLMATRRIPETESYEDWRDYCRFILEHSPAMRSTVAEHPLWWRELARQG